MGKKIISFSLWGSDPKYVVGAIKNAELAAIFYPDWKCRYYIGESTFSVVSNSVNQLNMLPNVEIIRMADSGNWFSMLWRFLPCSDPDVDVMISRDCDSRLSNREKLAVNEWLRSKKNFHIMKDHPYHRTKIMGGMWGAKKGILSDMDRRIALCKKEDYWQVDQDFLMTEIYPLIKDSCMIHDEIFKMNPFPSKRSNYEFVGDVFTFEDIRDDKFWRILKDFIAAMPIQKKFLIYLLRLGKKHRNGYYNK